MNIVIVEDFSKYTYGLFLKYKYDTFEVFKIFCKKVQNKKSSNMIVLRSCHGGEFENISLQNFFLKNMAFLIISFVPEPPTKWYGWKEK